MWDRLTALLRAGASLRSLGDTLQIAAAELLLRTTVPWQFTDAQHAFDYCNVANYWLRSSASPSRPRVVFPMASFINDVAKANKLHVPVPVEDVAGASLEALDEAILAFDISRATALASAWLRSGDRAENTTHLRDRLLVAPVRLLAGWPKMPGERECFARWEKEWRTS